MQLLEFPEFAACRPFAVYAESSWKSAAGTWKSVLTFV
jgi:hypothetical protein